MTFKQLVKLISTAKSDGAIFDEIVHEINYSFEHQKITWNDHEMLYDLAEEVYGF